VDRLNKRVDDAMETVSDTVDWKAQVMIVGGVLGAALGIASAYFYVRAAEEASAEGEPPPMPDTGDAVRVVPR
jgi:hypothetical protein